MYQVWFVPTELGKTAFGWVLTAMGRPTPEEDARFDAYLCDQDELAPDKHDYMRIRALPLEDA